MVEEFKRRMNGGIRRKLMEAENPPASIEQWYRRAMALDRNWRESRKEEEKGGRRGSTETDPATTIGVAEEATIASAGDNGACSDGRDREDKCSGSKKWRARGWGSSKKGSLCYGGGLGTKLLCLWGFWAHGPSLQESGAERESSG